VSSQILLLLFTTLETHWTWNQTKQQFVVMQLKICDITSGFSFIKHYWVMSLFWKMCYILDVHVTVHCVKFLIIKPTRYTDFSNLFLEWNYMFRTVPLFADTLRTGSGWKRVPPWSCSQAASKPVWHIPLLCAQWKTPDDGQRNCPKHVEFHSKNKYEKSVHLVGLI